MSIDTSLWPTDTLNKSRFTLHMAYRKTLRDLVQRDCPQLFKQYTMYVETRSKFCPLVYDTCDQIIKQLNQNGRQEQYLKLLSDIEDSIGTPNEFK